jgi:hypothetical protein
MMRKELILSSDGGGSGSKKCKRGYVDLCGFVRRESGFSSREDVLKFNLLHTFYFVLSM